MLLTEMGTEYKYSGIYLITNIVNNKVYVGQAQNLYVRTRQHVLYEKNPLLKKAFKKYGIDKFTIDVLEQCETDKLDEREQYWMDYYEVIDKNKGYNICPVAGSTRGLKKSQEEREKMSKRASQRIGKSNPFYGKHHSDDAKEKIRQKKIGQVVSDETKRKISQRHTGEKFSEERKMAISKALKGKDKTKEHGKHISESKMGSTLSEEHKASISKTIREKIDKGEIDYSDRYRKVNQIDKKTNEVLNTFESISEVAKYLGRKDANHVSDVCKHKPNHNTAYGYKWEYAD